MLVDNERVSAATLGGGPTVAVFHVGRALDRPAERVVVSQIASVVFGRLSHR